jgi:CRISPR-associated protein Cmr6
MTNDSTVIVLPRTVRDRFSAAQGPRHPGLLLDKYTPYVRQEDASKCLDRVVAAAAQHTVVNKTLERRGAWLKQISNAELFTATTTTRLTLHLARSAALENVGICLHPIYGFVYLPGSGLKGMAHAYACEHWLGNQPMGQAAPSADRQQKWETICRIFGTADSPWLSDMAKRLGVTVPPDAAAGSVVFHEAWPTKVPKLIKDLTNNHHSRYYGDGKATGDVPPPNDAESPIPVNFLAIGEGNEFLFALSPRRADTPTEDMQLARQWLAGALTHMGCGAKTNAGYGYFKLLANDETAGHPLPVAAQPLETCTLTADITLLTPAFLAGANQFAADDCQLRPGTLRGQLRWWWRTLHAGYLSPAELRRLEAAVWGDVNSGSRVAVHLECPADLQARMFDKKAISNSEHLPSPRDRRAIPGLSYLAYGMDESHKGESRKQRCYLPPGAKWTLHVTVRPKTSPPPPSDGKSKIPPPLPPLTIDQIRDQVHAALWLLGQYGGVGARSRKGFGSLQIDNAPAAEPTSTTLERLLRHAADLRRQCGHGQSNPNAASNREMHTSAFFLDTKPLMIECPLDANPWLALHQVGTAYQQAVKALSPKNSRAAIGLPRGTLASQFDRYASPVHISLHPKQNGALTARLLAFPQNIYNSTAETLEALEKFLQELEDTIQDVTDNQKKANRGTSQPSPQTALQPSNRGVIGGRPAGTQVDVTVIKPRPKGGYDVEESDGKKGVLTAANIPHDLSIGESYNVEIKDDGPKNRQYRWPQQPGAKKK